MEKAGGIAMIEATSCGGVVIFRGKILLLYKNYRNKYEGWVLPKGTVEEGEQHNETALREVKEETGLDVTNAEGGFLFSYHRENPGEGDNYFVDVYKYHMDFTEADIKLQTEETNAFQIADAAQLSEYDKQGIFLHYQSIKQALQ